jgi:hypothetical protein
MGTVITFPETGSAALERKAVGGSLEPATVIILPVIRVERHDDGPTGEVEAGGRSARGRRRRRRNSQS